MVELFLSFPCCRSLRGMLKILHLVGLPFGYTYTSRRFSRNGFRESKQVSKKQDNASCRLLQHADFFEVNNMFNVEDLFNARVHLGHKESSLDERMLPFIYGSRLGHVIIDLDQTAYHLRKALNFAAHTAFQGGAIMFFSRNALNGHLVEKVVLAAQEFAHTRFWRGGVFTNANIQFGAVTRLPDLCIFLNTFNNVLVQHAAVYASAKMCIPTIGIVDSNCNPNLITYPVPGNDDSPLAVQLYCNLFKKAILRGKMKRAV